MEEIDLNPETIWINILLSSAQVPSPGSEAHCTSRGNAEFWGFLFFQSRTSMEWDLQKAFAKYLHFKGGKDVHGELSLFYI